MQARLQELWIFKMIILLIVWQLEDKELLLCILEGILYFNNFKYFFSSVGASASIKGSLHNNSVIRKPPRVHRRNKNKKSHIIKKSIESLKE